MAVNSSDNNDTNKVLSGLETETQVTRFRFFSYSYFRYGVKNGREINFRIGKFGLRIAQHQFAFWVNMNPVFDLHF